MMISLHKKLNREGNGQSFVEFALVVPIFILLVLGIIEFGNLMMTMNLLTDAAREGARQAAVTAPDTGIVNTSVNNILGTAGYTATSITVNGPVGVAREVTVTVQISYNSLTNLIPGLDTRILQRSSTLRWEG